MLWREFSIAWRESEPFYVVYKFHPGAARHPVPSIFRKLQPLEKAHGRNCPAGILNEFFLQDQLSAIIRLGNIVFTCLTVSLNSSTKTKLRCSEPI